MRVDVIFGNAGAFTFVDCARGLKGPTPCFSCSVHHRICFVLSITEFVCEQGQMDLSYMLGKQVSTPNTKFTGVAYQLSNYDVC